MTTLDLNCDLGESPQRLADGSDEALLRLVTSANIACGGHAGDRDSMHALVRAAARLGVAVGAHPSFPDRANFGRAGMDLPPADLETSIHGQVRDLAEIASAAGARLTHVKPHGALYHAASARPAVADAVARAVLAVDPGLILVGLAGAPCLDRWRARGLRVAAEAFADRRYRADGSLTPRSSPHAVIHNPEQAAEQAVRLALGRGVVADDGAFVQVRAQTLCLHSDTPGAELAAAAIRRALKAAGVTLAPLARG